MTKYIDGYVCAFGNQHACFESSLTISDWASWVQAIGSVCAILTSAGVVWWQVRKQHRLVVDHAAQARRVEQLRLIEGHMQVLHHAHQQISAAADAFKNPDTAGVYTKVGHRTSDLDVLQAALDSADPSLLGSAGLDLEFRTARKHVHLALAELSEAMRYGRAGAAASSVMAAIAKRIDEFNDLSKVHMIALNHRAHELSKEIEEGS